jgi:hypothetical protein
LGTPPLLYSELLPYFPPLFPFNATLPQISRIQAEFHMPNDRTVQARRRLCCGWRRASRPKPARTTRPGGSPRATGSVEDLDPPPVGCGQKHSQGCGLLVREHARAMLSLLPCTHARTPTMATSRHRTGSHRRSHAHARTHARPRSPAADTPAVRSCTLAPRRQGRACGKA